MFKSPSQSHRRSHQEMKKTETKTGALWLCFDHRLRFTMPCTSYQVKSLYFFLCIILRRTPWLKKSSPFLLPFFLGGWCFALLTETCTRPSDLLKSIENILSLMPTDKRVALSLESAMEASGGNAESVLEDIFFGGSNGRRRPLLYTLQAVNSFLFPSVRVSYLFILYVIEKMNNTLYLLSFLFDLILDSIFFLVSSFFPP